MGCQQHQDCHSQWFFYTMYCMQLHTQLRLSIFVCMCARLLVSLCTRKEAAGKMQTASGLLQDALQSSHLLKQHQADCDLCVAILLSWLQSLSSLDNAAEIVSIYKHISYVLHCLLQKLLLCNPYLACFMSFVLNLFCPCCSSSSSQGTDPDHAWHSEELH